MSDDINSKLRRKPSRHRGVSYRKASETVDPNDFQTPVYGVCEIWVFEDADVPGGLPILGAIHASAEEIKLHTGRWPFCLAIAPLLWARVSREVLTDGEIPVRWPTTIEMAKGPDDTFQHFLMGIPVLEIESYPPQFCRVIGCVPEQIAHCDPQEAAEVALAVIKADPVSQPRGS